MFSKEANRRFEDRRALDVICDGGEGIKGTGSYLENCLYQ